MGIYLFRKQVLLECLDNDLTDFGQHVIPRAIERYRVQAHLFDGYWRDIGTIRSFFEAHQDLVSPAPPFSFHDPDWPFFTHPRYLPGAELDNCSFERSVVAEGVVARNSAVQDSVIGVRSMIRGAQIRRSLIMGADFFDRERTEDIPLGIGRGTRVENAIVDKNARIGRNVQIGVRRDVERDDGPGWAIREGITLVAKNAVIPDGSVI
jgi:glucose-1-phosphate adenylyltransferase